MSKGVPKSTMWFRRYARLRGPTSMQGGFEGMQGVPKVNKEVPKVWKRGPNVCKGFLSYARGCERGS